MQLPSRRKERRRKGKGAQKKGPSPLCKTAILQPETWLIIMASSSQRPLSDNAPFYNQKPGLSPPKPSTKGKEKNAEEGTLPTLQNRDSTTRNLAYDVPYLLQSPRQCAVLQPETWLMIYSIKGP